MVLIVRGPIKMSTSKDYECTKCGKAVPQGGELWLGRAVGHMIHACSKKCFDGQVADIEAHVSKLSESGH
jgi:hypothetical protein